MTGETAKVTTEPSAEDPAEGSTREFTEPADRLPGCTVTARGLCRRFGSRTLWNGLDFDLAPGDMVALTGPSGCGKSTLLNCMGLLDTPTSGTLTVDGTDAARIKGHAARLFRRDRLGYLFQDYALIENGTVDDNLDVALIRTSRRDRGKAKAGALSAVGLSGRGNDVIRTLSGGEQQRVALARLMCKRPGLVLADEPTGALDKDNARIVIDVLRTMAESGATVVIATHSDAIAAACDRAIDLGGDGGAAEGAARGRTAGGPDDSGATDEAAEADGGETAGEAGKGL